MLLPYRRGVTQKAIVWCLLWYAIRDCPLSDAALFQKQRSLTPAEKQVLLYSRSSDAVIPRSSNAMICYAGHSPHYHGYAAVRPLENTCNLDAGAFQNGVLMCVNHTCREVTPVIGTQSLEVLTIGS